MAGLFQKQPSVVHDGFVGVAVKVEKLMGTALGKLEKAAANGQGFFLL